MSFFVGLSGNGWSSCCQKSCWCYFGNDQGNIDVHVIQAAV